MTLTAQKKVARRLGALKARRYAANKEITAVHAGLYEIAREVCPFKVGQTIISDAGNKFLIVMIEPGKSFGGYSFSLPAYSLNVKRIKRDGTERRDRESISPQDDFKVFDPATAPKKPKPTSNTRAALDHALSILSKTKAETIRAQFSIK